jgi:glutathione synthase/RimK-type ligase-like ATP-grasp enzyme
MEQEIILVGDPASERTKYFLAASCALHLRTSVLPPPNLAIRSNKEGFRDFDFTRLKYKSAKIDPPCSIGSKLSELPGFAGRYRQFLLQLDAVPGLRLLNSGQAIVETLDKLECKRRLEKAGLPVTPLIAENPKSIEELRTILSSVRATGLFIKPRFGSGAAGILAWRRNPVTKAEVLYTSAVLNNGILRNSGTLRRIIDFEEIDRLLSAAVTQETIVEEWLPKAKHGGKSFDLRVVFQFGHAVMFVVRCSRGPVTNLHLNNAAAPVALLALNKHRQREIEEICSVASRCFSGLNCAGFDILLTPDSLKPYIIEVNGQGDFMHQDARGANSIFIEQLFRLT